MPDEAPVALSPEEFVVRVARETWELFSDHFVTLAGAAVVAVALSLLTLGLASGTLAVGYILLVQRLRRGEPAGIADSVHFDHFVGGVVASVLVGFGVTLGMALVVPGIVLGILWAFTFHAMAYQDLAAVSAMTASWALVRHYVLHVVALLAALLLLNAIAGAVVFGALVSVPLTMIALTAGYELLTGAVPPAGHLPE